MSADPPAAGNATRADQRKDAIPPAPRGSSPNKPQQPRFRLRSRAARLQLLLRRARESAFVTGPRPVQPVLPRPGAREPRQTDHLEGHSDPGDVHPEGELLGLEADDALSDRGSGVRRQQRPVTAAPGEERDRQRPAAGYRSALVAEPVARLRADSPLHLPALL